MKTKTVVVLIAFIIGLAILWYLISPIFRVIELQEPSPLESQTQDITKEEVRPELPLKVDDALDTMDASTKADFERAVQEMKDKVIEQKETMPSKSAIIAQGNFIPRAHDVKGKALLIEKDGQYTLRFEDFETINGPDLRIYLSSELGIDDAIDLGAIRATKGNVNYPLSDSVDVKKYSNVLVWCRAFHVLFSYALVQ